MRAASRSTISGDSSSTDGRGVSGGSDPEHHHLAHVHGEGLAGAVHDVQRHRAQHRHGRGRQVSGGVVALFIFFSVHPRLLS